MVKVPNSNDASQSDEEEQNNMSVDSDNSSSDSEDESSMSENECERRRADCLDNLVQLERQFEILKEQLYRERISHIEKELNDVKGGRSQEYLAPLQKLNENMNERKEVAEIQKKYRMENIRHKFESEEQAAIQHFESEKQLAMDNLFDELMEKIRRLEEDRHNVETMWDEWGNRTVRTKVRGPGRKKAVTVSGPYIVYMLKDEDIVEDWTLIRKSLSQQRDTYHQASSIMI